MEDNKKEKNKKYLNNNLLYGIPHKYNNYCCPFCIEIPEILSFNENNNSLLLKCQNHGVKPINLHSYLESMSKILNSSQNNNNNICPNHNMPFILHCKNCDINLCNKCNTENNKHLNHIKYKNVDVYPNSNEITFINNRINFFLEEKNKLIKRLENINDKIVLYETILGGIEKDFSNYYKNINLKHLIYGEDINLTKIYKDPPIPIPDIKKLNFDDIFNKEFLNLIKNKKEINLLNKKTGNEVIYSFFNNSLKDIFKDNNIKIKEDISFLNANIFKNLKTINLKGNNIVSLNFLSKSNFQNLEFLSLNDNNIKDIEPLKSMNAPLIKQLYLSKNMIGSIKAFENIKMKNLQILWLSDNNIVSIEPFKNSHLEKLEKLGINKNKINNIKVFKYAKFPLLMELYINDNEINFENKENLEIIIKLENKIEDFFY